MPLSGFGFGGYYAVTVDHQTDQDLLREYGDTGSEAAFAELVRRYVDLVYSVAHRTVGTPDLAKDVAQSVFLVLARECRGVAGHAVLAGWLHRTTHNLAVKAVRTEARRRRREQQAVAMNEFLSAEPEASWESLAPHLDAVLDQLKPEDRDVVLLRYFQQKSAREIAAALGLSEEAAQKRATRALERLRSAFGARGVAASSVLVAGMLSANAVQAAPAGLGTGIAAAAAASNSAAGAGLIKVITMTTMQKVAVTTVVVTVAVGSAVYEAQRASRLERRLTLLQQQQAPALPQTRAEPSRLEPPAPALVQSNTPARTFDWRQLESADYRQYLANLRAIGCPERTVRDIIVADVNDLYRQRLRALMPATNRIEYWKPGNPFAQLASQVLTNAQALAGERRQLVATLLGTQADLGADHFSVTEVYDAVNARALDFLSPEKQTAVNDVLLQFSARISGLDKHDRQAVKQVQAEKDAALLQVLSPEEKFEVDLRKTHTADGLRVTLRGLEVTEEEFRTLFRFQKEYDDKYGPPLYAPEGPEAIAASRVLEQKLMNVLGQQRYQVFWNNKHPGR